MPRRTKKPAVKPELRRQWLQRFEAEGESAPQIAKADGYDVRTVRKQIEQERQAREAREARFVVLRQALEKHYADLAGFAEGLDSALSGDPATIPLPERQERMWSALREHLPRSPIWKSLDRWEHLHTEMTRLKKEAEGRLRREVATRGTADFAEHPVGTGFRTEAFVGVVISRLIAIAQRHDRSFPLEQLDAHTRPDGFVRVAYGYQPCAVVPPEQAEAVERLIAEVLAAVGQWPECESMERILPEAARLRENISEELATIRLRRVVPGRCKYCPV